MDPKNPLCKFHRASVYFSLENNQAALKDLEELKEIVPKESLVYFLIGKVCIINGIFFFLQFFKNIDCILHSTRNDLKRKSFFNFETVYLIQYQSILMYYVIYFFLFNTPDILCLITF